MSPSPARTRIGAAMIVAAVLTSGAATGIAVVTDDAVDRRIARVLENAGFTGRIELTLESRLGHRLDPGLVTLGRLLFFDKSGAVRRDNTCAGCHAPASGFGDTQSIAIGVQNNNLVGPNRRGPRNQRRSPSVVNTAFYPNLMWNGRFASLSDDPFDNSAGFLFPLPEGATAFPPLAPNVTHLLVAQAHIPPTELVEVAGFTGTRGTLGVLFDQFDDGVGEAVPPPDTMGFRNEPIRQAVLTRLNATREYRRLFGQVFPPVARGGAIDFTMFGRAIAEFEFSLVRATAPLDEFARGDRSAMTNAEKRGALVFFGKAHCVSCHAVDGRSNEMFSDFKMHVIGVPQIAPAFGVGTGNVVFDGPNADEDFGLEQVTGDKADRYKFRTSPLRNAALQPAFFHNGAFTRIEDAIAHHLNVVRSATRYDPVRAGIDNDLWRRLGPIQPVLERLDPQLALPTALTPSELDDLVSFVRDGLLDRRAQKQLLCRLVPSSVPSGLSLLRFEGCEPSR